MRIIQSEDLRTVEIERGTDFSLEVSLAPRESAITVQSLSNTACIIITKQEMEAIRDAIDWAITEMDRRAK